MDIEHHPHDARAVANEILRRANKLGINLTIMQLIKLVYLANGWSLALLGRPLVKQSAQAWQYGPVYPHVYKTFNRFGATPITDVARDKRTGIEFAEHFDEDESALIDAVVNAYGRMHAFQLSNIMHRAGTPWSVTFEESGPYSEIPENRIKEHFLELKKQRNVEQR